MITPVEWRLLLIATVSAASATPLRPQARTVDVDSLRLSYMRILTEATDTCTAIIHTSGSMNIQTAIRPGNLKRWIDTALAYKGRSPVRARGQRVNYAWIPMTLGITRTITDRFDAFSFVIGGHAIPIWASEIPRIARLLNSTAAKTVRMSGARSCPTDPDG